MNNDDVDRQIEAYRTQLSAEADLATGDLDEIEDHLRSLTEDLRERGMPAGVAVTEAARRLGDPHTIAREHARVRTGFGTKLSRARAWSAAALLIPVLAATAHALLIGEIWLASIDLAFDVVMLAALIARVSWARPVLLGSIGFYLVSGTLWFLLRWPVEPIWLVLEVGLVAFVMPWRREQLRVAGVALALQTWAGCAAGLAIHYQSIALIDDPPMIPTSLIALGAALLATAGGIMRARWSGIASAVSAVTLTLAILDVSTIDFSAGNAELFGQLTVGLLTTGAMAAALGSVLLWRSARSTFGSLRSIVS